MNTQTVKCPICGEPYKVYPFFAGDQSACPQCQQKAESKKAKWNVVNHLGDKDRR